MLFHYIYSECYALCSSSEINSMAIYDLFNWNHHNVVFNAQEAYLQQVVLKEHSAAGSESGVDEGATEAVNLIIGEISGINTGRRMYWMRYHLNYCAQN